MKLSSLLTLFAAALLLVTGCGGGSGDTERFSGDSGTEHSTVTVPGNADGDVVRSQDSRIDSGDRSYDLTTELLKPVPPSELEARQAELEREPAVPETPRAGELPVIIEQDEVREPLEGTEFAAHQMIATFREGVSEAEIESLLQEHGLWTINNLGYESTTGTVLLLATEDHPGAENLSARVADNREELGDLELITGSAPESSGMLEKMRALLDEEAVANVSRNQKLELHAVPNDPLYDEDDQSIAPRGDAEEWLSGFNIEPAWDRTKGSEDITIAILDTGVSLSHQDLAPKIDENRSDDFWTNSDPGTDGDENCGSHGTQSAGVAAAIGDNGLGIASPDWKSTLISLRVAEPNCTLLTSNSTKALNHIADKNDDGNPSNDIHVASMSYGGFGVDPPQPGSAHHPEMQAANAAYNKGALLFGSAGNNSLQLPAQTQSGAQVDQYPAGFDSVMQVASVDHNLVKQGYSNYGVDTELSGQGNHKNGAPSVLSTAFHPNDDAVYTYHGGTSAASPNAAGVATLGWSMNQSLTNEDMRQLLKDTGFDLDEINPGFAGLIGRGPNADWLTRTLNYEAENNSMCEPNQSRTAACVRDLETTYQDWLRSGDDGSDWFEFTLQPGDYFVGDVLYVNRGATVEADLYDAAGDLLDEGEAVDDNKVQVEHEAGSSVETVFMEVRETGGESAPYDYAGWEVKPVIDSVDPAAEQVGSFITISGTNFGEEKTEDSAVEFADGEGGWVPASAHQNWSDTEVEAKVPAGAHSSTEGVRISNQFTSSEPEPFEVIPRIFGVDTSTNYERGDTLVIDGAGFGSSRGDSTVTFLNDEYGDVVVDPNGGYEDWSDQEIQVTIPDDAHSGPVIVTKNGNDSNQSDEITIMLPAPPNLDGEQF